jgi:hypothetical protein
MLRLSVAAITLSAVAAPLSACGEDPALACTETYAHLTGLGKRRTTPELEARFLTSCVEADDPERLTCLGAARTPGEALACKARKKRPD